jgi:peptide/nickel transport system permease protein
MPSFWLGIVLILFLLVVFKWLPPMVYTPFWVNPWQNMLQLVWPALAVGYRYSAVATRMTRSAMLEVLREDYIRTARAKGAGERRVIYVHAMRNALIPYVTIAGLETGALLSGSVITERIFAIPGMGQLMISNIAERDYPVVQGAVLVVATLYVVINFVVDLLYAWLDPRVAWR